MLSWNTEVSAGDVITLLSVAAAIVTFVFSNRMSFVSERRKQTFELLSRIFEDGPVADARVIMARWIAEGKVIEDDAIDDPEVDRVIIFLIDFYEFTCEGAYRGVVDRDLLDQESGGRMERAFFVVREYIRQREDRLTAQNAANGLPPVKLYRHLRWFLKEMRGTQTD